MVNDITIATGIIAFFILAGTFIPVISTGIETTQREVTADVDGLSDDITGERSGSSYSTFWKIPMYILGMFTWTFGVLPAWVDTALLVPRIVLAFIIARNIWIGGGG